MKKLFKDIPNKKFNNPKGGVIMSQKIQKGFTLIELLIVIVIIGILAAVVIGVLNPVQQQNRARDAAARSSLSKMALSTKSLQVSQARTSNRAPSTSEFSNGLGNVSDNAECLALPAGWTPADPDQCSFSIEGVTLPQDCAASGLTGVSAPFNGTSGTPGPASQCGFLYRRTADNFLIGFKGAADPRTFYAFIYEENQATGTVQEGFFSCDITIDVTSVAISAAGDTASDSGGGTCAILN